LTAIRFVDGVQIRLAWKAPTRRPVALSSALVSVVVVPFPFVPVMWIVG